MQPTSQLPRHSAGRDDHIVIAPDKFKGSLTAPEVAAAIARGIRTVDGARPVTILPVADGGDGTVAATLARGFRAHTVGVRDALGDHNQSVIAVRDDIAVIEIATICGLAQARRLDPLEASSHGVGEAIVAALDHGATSILVGLGGSATTDGGAGMLAALGATFRDRDGKEIHVTGGSLGDAAEIDWSGIDTRVFDVDLTMLCDVTNPLLGENGAAQVFAPQKGASADQVVDLEHSLAHFLSLVDEYVPPSIKASPIDLAAEPGAGAAGGTAFGGLCVGARLSSGAHILLDLLDFDEALLGAALVVTGEGRLDIQTLAGKAPSVVLARAQRARIPVVAVVGSSDLERTRARQEGFADVFTLAERDERCVDDPAISEHFLEEIGTLIATGWTRPSPPDPNESTQSLCH